jgi:hypothetical protein
MKTIVILAAVVAVCSAWTLPSNPPIGIPGTRPIWPGLMPGVTVRPPVMPPTLHPTVHTEILNFPSDDDPQIRVHVNIKQDVPEASHRIIRSILPPTNQPRPPVFPEAGHKPGMPEYPGTLPIAPEHPGNLPIIPGPEGPGQLPILPPNPEFPTPSLPPNPNPSEEVYTYADPATGKTVVKMRIQYNIPHASNPIIYRSSAVDPLYPWIPDFPQPDPIHPSVPEQPGNLPHPLPEGPGQLPILPEPESPEVIPMPPPVMGKTPEVEIFLDIGEQEEY